MRWRSSLDLPLFLSASLLVLLALIVLSSALRGAGASAGIEAHALRVVLAAVAAAVAFRTDHRRVIRIAPPLFLIVVALSAAANLSAALRAGTNRWIDIGTLTFQPGELGKICLVLLIAHLVGRAVYEPLRRRVILAWAVGGGALVVAVAAQPDLGSAAILFGTGAGMVFWCGLSLSWKKIAGLAAACLVLLPVGWIWGLRDYQRLRILAFWDPAGDPLGAGYQALQARIAVGNGGFLGAGWMEGSQTANQFLPAPHTDFVFGVLAEEFGFLGVFVVLILYLVLGLRLIRIAADAAADKDVGGATMVGGLFLMLFLQALYNIAMVAGMVPIKGFPLPLMSYGGNSLLITGVAIGLAASVRRGRYLA